MCRKALDADLARWVQRILKLDIEGAITKAAPVHRAEHLNVAYGVEPKSLRDPLLHDRQHLPNSFFRFRRIDEIEVAAFDLGQARAFGPG
jgi:hypothetical protein